MGTLNFNSVERFLCRATQTVYTIFEISTILFTVIFTSTAFACTFFTYTFRYILHEKIPREWEFPVHIYTFHIHTHTHSNMWKVLQDMKTIECDKERIESESNKNIGKMQRYNSKWRYCCKKAKQIFTWIISGSIFFSRNILKAI